MIDDLLPASEEYYTRALACANDSYSRLTGSIDVIPQIGSTTVPDGWMPWLLRNRGLQALMPYVDWSLLLEEGPAWLTIRGTAEASVDALSWIGWDVAFEDGDTGTTLYDHYQIHLDHVPWHDELIRIIGVENIAKSTDSVFFRLISGWDVRAVRGARSRFARAIFGRASGIDVRPDWPRLSFKVHETILWPASTESLAIEAMTLLTYVRRRGHVILGRSHMASLASRGPIAAIQLFDSAVALGGASHHALDGIRPLAGVVGGRSIHGRRQALHVAMRKVIGEKPVAGRSKFGKHFRLATVEQLMAVADPIDLSVLVAVGSLADALDAVTDMVTIDNSAHFMAAEEALDGPRQLVAFADLGDAAWSGLPWSDAAWGEGRPATLAIDETTET